MNGDLTPEQQAVFDQACAFIDAPCVRQPWFAIQSLAGCGKTHLLAKLARRYPQGLLCAPYGRTAAMLAKKTGLPASTVHSAIYRFIGESLPDPKGRRTPLFKPRVREGDWNGDLVFLDESGVVDERMANDLLDTGCKIVCTGDPGQLPPVRGRRFFDRADAVLHQIHRQALDSAIIRQAHNVRATGQYWADGDDFQIKAYVSHDDIMAADAILCWRNDTRRALNRLRRAHGGLNGPPRAGEPVMCLKNSRTFGVMNGAVYTLLADVDPATQLISVVNDMGDAIQLSETWFEDVYDDRIPGLDIDETTGFAFGYCATVHKFIGSEAERIILVDEYSRHDGRREFCYTGITRAAKSIIVQRNY